MGGGIRPDLNKPLPRLPTQAGSPSIAICHALGERAGPSCGRSNRTQLPKAYSGEDITPVSALATSISGPTCSPSSSKTNQGPPAPASNGGLTKAHVPRRPFRQALQALLTNPFNLFARSPASPEEDLLVLIRQSLYIHTDPITNLPDDIRGIDSHIPTQDSREDLAHSNATERPAISTLPIDSLALGSLRSLTKCKANESIENPVRPRQDNLSVPDASSRGRDFLWEGIQMLRARRSSAGTTNSTGTSDLLFQPNPFMVKCDTLKSNNARPDEQAPSHPLHLIGGSRRASPWTALGLLGAGAQGQVYLVKHKKHGLIAMKVISLATMRRMATLSRIVDELKVLERLEKVECPFLLGPKSIRGRWAWTSPKGFLHITTVRIFSIACFQDLSYTSTACLPGGDLTRSRSRDTSEPQ